MNLLHAHHLPLRREPCPDHPAQNFSNFSLALALAGFLGPMLAGFSIDHAGFTLACLYLSVLSFIPLVLLALWGARLPPGERKDAPAGGLRSALAEPGMWRVLAIGR